MSAPTNASWLAPTEHLVNLRGISIHYLEWGEPTKRPLLLLHGGAAHAHWWDHIGPLLARNWRVLALDLRGHGDSSWVSAPLHYQVEDYVDDLTHFVLALKISSFVLLGHSLGGFVALSYAISHPLMLRALVVVDIGFRIGGNRYLRLLRQMPAPVYDDENDLYERFRLLPVETRVAPEVLRGIAWHSVRSSPDGRLILKCDRATLSREPRDVRTKFSHIQCPTLILRGVESRNLTVTTLAEMTHLCPRARGEEIAGAGHHIFLDNPQEFLARVQGFLGEIKE